MFANLLFAAIFLLAALPGPKIASLIGHDRVWAGYPGFHKVEGNTGALAAVGIDRPVATGGGTQDAVIIQKVGTIGAEAARTFDLRAAIAIAPSDPLMTQLTTAAPVVYTGSTTVCGHPAFAFITRNTVHIPAYESEPATITELNTHVVALFNGSVWHADYARLDAPNLVKTQARNLIAFTSNFCVEPNYSA